MGKNDEIEKLPCRLLHRAIGRLDVEKLNVQRIIFLPNMRYWAENIKCMTDETKDFKATKFAVTRYREKMRNVGKNGLTDYFATLIRKLERID